MVVEMTVCDAFMNRRPSYGYRSSPWFQAISQTAPIGAMAGIHAMDLVDAAFTADFTGFTLTCHRRASRSTATTPRHVRSFESSAPPRPAKPGLFP
jgi:hypothetical protein